MATHWSRKLKAIGACSEAVEWANGQPSFAVAWKTCERGDWMLWLLAKLNHKREHIVSVACDCAELALPYTKDPRVKACIEVARAWTRGEATIEEVREARNAASAASAYAASAAYAAYAAYASAAYAAYASAAYAAYASAAYASAAYAAYARKATLAKCADLVRREFPILNLEKK